MNEVRVTRWQGDTPPDENELRKMLREEGLSFYAWSNAPGDHYPAHTHAYNKVLLVARGSIRFGLPDRGESLELRAGDRLLLPAGVLHDAIVGSEGVLCYEAHA